MTPSPLLEGIAFLVFSIIGIYFICVTFDVKNLFLIVLFSAIYIVSPIHTSSISNYFPWNGIYGLCVALAGVSVWVLNRFKFGYLWAVIPTVLLLGLFQTYICLVVGLVIILAFFKVVKGEKLINVLKFIGFSVIMVIISVVIYLIAFKISLLITKTTASSGHNGLGSVGFLGIKRYVVLFAESYFFFGKYIICQFEQGTANNLSSLINAIDGKIILATLFAISVLVFSIIQFVKIIKIKKFSAGVIVFAVCLVCLIPFGFCCHELLTNGRQDVRIFTQGLFVYILPIILYEYLNSLKDENLENKSTMTINLGRFCKVVMVLLSVMVIFSNISWANKTYVEREKIERKKLSDATSICVMIETNEAYENGIAICFVDSGKKIIGYDAVCLTNTIKDILKKEYYFVTLENFDDFEQYEQELENMTIYPDSGGTMVKTGVSINGVLQDCMFVKIS